MKVLDKHMRNGAGAASWNSVSDLVLKKLSVQSVSF